MLDCQCVCFLAHHLRFPHLDAVSLVVAGDDRWMESGMHACVWWPLQWPLQCPSSWNAMTSWWLINNRVVKVGMNGRMDDQEDDKEPQTR